MNVITRIKEAYTYYRAKRVEDYNERVRNEAVQRINIRTYTDLASGETSKCITFDGEVVKLCDSSTDVISMLDDARGAYYSLNAKEPTAKLI